MNAVASVNPPLGGLNTLLCPALSPAPGPAPGPATISLPRALPAKAAPTASSTAATPPGFVSLINLLLVPAGLDSGDEPEEPPTMRSPQLIADALIRSMLNRSMLDRSMLNRSMPSSDLPTAGTLATAETTPGRVLAGKLTTPAGTPSRKERSAPAGLVEPTLVARTLLTQTPVAQTPVAQMPVAAVPVPAAPVETPTVGTPWVAPANAVTAPPPASAIPIRDDNPHNAPQPAQGGTVTPAVKPELAFGLRLTPIDAPQSDFSGIPEQPFSVPPADPLSQPDPPQARSLAPAQSSDVAAPVIDDIVTTVVAGVASQVAPESAQKPTAPEEAKSKLPPESSATPANPRPAPQPEQSTIPAVTAVAEIPSVADHSNPFARAFEPMASALSAPSDATPSAIFAERAPQTAAEALRAAEPAAPAESAPPPVPAQTIAVRIALPDVPAVDVHVMDRAGQLQVAVRTPDADLQSSLRQDLGTLVNSLERSGFHAEAFTPHDAFPAAGTSSQMSFQNNGRQQDSGSGEHASGNPGDGKHDSRQGSQQQPGQQRQRGRQSQTWIETMENAA